MSTKTRLANRGFDGDNVDVAVKSLQTALRALAMLPEAKWPASDYVPHPLATVRAELNQAMRELGRSE